MIRQHVGSGVGGGEELPAGASRQKVTRSSRRKKACTPVKLRWVSLGHCFSSA